MTGCGLFSILSLVVKFQVAVTEMKTELRHAQVLDMILCVIASFLWGNDFWKMLWIGVHRIKRITWLSNFKVMDVK